jgi:hypothetical protein
LYNFFFLISVGEGKKRDKKIRQSWAPRTGTHDVPVDTTKNHETRERERERECVCIVVLNQGGCHRHGMVEAYESVVRWKLMGDGVVGGLSSFLSFFFFSFFFLLIHLAKYHIFIPQLSIAPCYLNN